MTGSQSQYSPAPKEVTVHPNDYMYSTDLRSLVPTEAKMRATTKITKLGSSREGLEPSSAHLILYHLLS